MKIKLNFLLSAIKGTPFLLCCSLINPRLKKGTRPKGSHLHFLRIYCDWWVVRVITTIYMDTSSFFSAPLLFLPLSPFCFLAWSLYVGEQHRIGWSENSIKSLNVFPISFNPTQFADWIESRIFSLHSNEVKPIGPDAVLTFLTSSSRSFRNPLSSSFSIVPLLSCGHGEREKRDNQMRPDVWDR